MTYISINRFAALVDRTPRGIRMLCKSGRIKAEKLGRDWLIKPKEVEEYKNNVRRKKFVDISADICVSGNRKTNGGKK